VTVNAHFSGSGSIRQSGSGTTVLLGTFASSRTDSTPVTIGKGTLQVDGLLLAQDLDPAVPLVQMLNGTTLSGKGTIVGTVDTSAAVFAFISPGSSSELADLTTNDFVLTGGTRLEPRITHIAATNLRVNGTVNLTGGGLFPRQVGLPPSVGTVFTILVNDTRTPFRGHSPARRKAGLCSTVPAHNTGSATSAVPATT
jgi:hypothetical protein